MNKDNLPRIKNSICPKKDYSNLTTQLYCLDGEPFMLKEVETAIKDMTEKENNAIADEIIKMCGNINTSFCLNRDKVIEIVSKSIPKKVNVVDSCPICPVCGQDGILDVNYNGEHAKFCFNCGQRLDWSDLG